jgi:large subunit ribosomal protein L10
MAESEVRGTKKERAAIRETKSDVAKASKKEAKRVASEKERASITAKKNDVDEMVKNLKDKKSILLLNLSKTPGKLVQRIRKKLKDQNKAYFKISKLAVVKRALEAAKLPSQLYDDVNFPVAVIGLKDISPYEVSSMFMDNMLSVAAKEGDVSPFEIVIPAGETEMPPGPALTQLKQAGLNVKVDKGKIAITSDSKLAKVGDKLTKEKVAALQMLNIKPFKVGLTIWRAFDGETIFSAEVLGTSVESIVESLKEAIGQGLNVSLNANYPTENNISIMLVNAIRLGNTLGEKTAAPEAAPAEVAAAPEAAAETAAPEAPAEKTEEKSS